MRRSEALSIAVDALEKMLAGEGSVWESKVEEAIRVLKPPVPEEPLTLTDALLWAVDVIEDGFDYLPYYGQVEDESRKIEALNLLKEFAEKQDDNSRSVKAGY